MAKDVEQAGVVLSHELSPDALFAERRAALARQYTALPAHGSPGFWTLLEDYQENGQALPLEVLVKVLRAAFGREDTQTWHRLCEIIIGRLQQANEQWVRQVLASTRVLTGEQQAMAADLYADLCELVLRRLLDPTQHFWEENFQHSLRFARKNVYESFMRHEGRWHKVTPGAGKRVPYTLLESLDRFGGRDDVDDDMQWDIGDERAEEALQAVEQTDIAALLIRLPIQQRTVVWLTFWEGYTAKAAAELLAISDRTVRNRLRAALAQLRKVFEIEQEVIDGESA